MLDLTYLTLFGWGDGPLFFFTEYAWWMKDFPGERGVKIQWRYLESMKWYQQVVREQPYMHLGKVA